MDQKTRQQIAATLRAAAGKLSAVSMPRAPFLGSSPSYDDKLKSTKAHKEAIKEVVQAEFGADFKAAVVLAKKMAKLLMAMLPAGFKASLPAPTLGVLPGSFVTFYQPIHIDNKLVASVDARFNMKRTQSYGDDHTLLPPKWSVNMWIPMQNHAYAASSVDGNNLAAVKALLASKQNPITPDVLLSALGGPKAGKATGPVTLDAIKKFAMAKKGWLDLEHETPKDLHFSTRENGSVGDEEAGDSDVALANNLGKAVINEFGRDAVDVRLEVVDEWVNLNIRLK